MIFLGIWVKFNRDLSGEWLSSKLVFQFTIALDVYRFGLNEIFIDNPFEKLFILILILFQIFLILTRQEGCVSMVIISLYILYKPFHTH
jgi:hypothetical protein